MKNIIIPAKIANPILALKLFSANVGKIWIKTSPKRAPVEKATKIIKYFFNILAEQPKKRIPTNEIRLTMTVAQIANNQLLSIYLTYNIFNYLTNPVQSRTLVKCWINSYFESDGKNEQIQYCWKLNR